MKQEISKPSNLLNVDKNAKTVKGQPKGYLTGILYLFPHKAFGFNLCPMADLAGCAEPCLNTAGRGAMPQQQAARLRKTWLFHFERDWFMAQLYRDIEALERKAEREGLLPAVRLNGTSDIDWEEIRFNGKSMMEWFPFVQFYDYTKRPHRVRNRNYHLTFSYSAAPEYQKTVKLAEKLGMNMAVVFLGQMPETFMGKPVVNGDEDDLRFLDPPGCVVGLKAKGKAKKIVDSPLVIARSAA
jgi:hypothetical protein